MDEVAALYETVAEPLDEAPAVLSYKGEREMALKAIAVLAERAA